MPELTDDDRVRLELLNTAYLDLRLISHAQYEAIAFHYGLPAKASSQK